MYVAEKRPFINYKQALGEADNLLLAEEKRREILFEKLLEGIDTTVLGIPLTFKLEPYGRNDIYRKIKVLEHFATEIAQVSVKAPEDSKTALDLEKSYSLAEGHQLRAIGIIAFATSLLFQDLTRLGVTNVLGRIERNNGRSILSRVKAEDLIRGGFYPNRVRMLTAEKNNFADDNPEENFILLDTIIDPKIPQIAQPTTLQDILNFTPPSYDD